MGKNKQIRKRIKGHFRTIAEHQAKIERERAKPNPNVLTIRKWEKDIDIARRAVRKLEERLES